MFAKQFFSFIQKLSHDTICDNLNKVIINSINYNIENGYQSNDLLIDNL